MNLTGLLTGIGQAGSDVAAGNLAAQELKIRDLFDKLGLQQGKVNLAESQERLKRLQGAPATEADKFAQLRTAFKNVFGRDWSEDEAKQLFGLQIPKTTTAKTPFELYFATHPNATYEQWKEASEKERPDKAIKVNTTKSGEPYEIVDADGKTYSYGDPNMPAPLKAFMANWETQEAKGERKKAIDQARRDAELLSRSISMLDEREAAKERDNLLDVARRGITGHSYLKAVQQEVNAAEAAGGRGTTAGDRVIADGFMQLMFGPDAKGIRGSTQVMEIMLKQGGWSDKAIAKLNDALAGGKLSQDVRNQILETSTRQVGIWDAYVNNFGSLTTDKKSQALLNKYWETISKGDSDAARILGATPNGQ